MQRNDILNYRLSALIGRSEPGTTSSYRLNSQKYLERQLADHLLCILHGVSDSFTHYR